jgi:hypothetical protein
MEQPQWSADLLRVIEQVLADNFRGTGLKPEERTGIHLAILVEPYLSLVLSGKKTIESRFGVQNRAPHNRVAPEDIVLLKEPGGPVVGICRVKKTWFFDLEKTSLSTVRSRFAESLCAADPSFWAQRSDAKLATLMLIDQVTSIKPIVVAKRDRRGWVTLRVAASLFHSSAR